MDPALAALTALPLPASGFVILTGSGRTLGALFGLWGLYFILGPAALIRMVLAFILAGPAIAGQMDTLVALATQDRLAALAVPVREFALGLGLGLLASLPFFAVMGAAMMIDQYRGDFSPGNPGPEGEQIGSFATLKVVMALFLFVELGGFLLLVSMLYQSYQVLPLGPGSLGLAPDFGAQIGDILMRVFVTLLLVALPVIAILLLIEFGLQLTLRLSKSIELPSADFLVKNLVFTLALPGLVFALVRVIQMAFDRHPDALQLLLELLGP